MSDFLEELLADEGVVSRPVTFGGKTGDVLFRRISAAQKAELVKGQRVSQVEGQKSTFEFDLGQNAQNKMLMVFYSVANADGSQYFKKLEKVRAIDAGKLDALYAVAADVNKDDLKGADVGNA